MGFLVTEPTAIFNPPCKCVWNLKKRKENPQNSNKIFVPPFHPSFLKTHLVFPDFSSLQRTKVTRLDAAHPAVVSLKSRSSLEDGSSRGVVSRREKPRQANNISDAKCSVSEVRSKPDIKAFLIFSAVPVLRMMTRWCQAIITACRRCQKTIICDKATPTEAGRGEWRAQGDSGWSLHRMCVRERRG